MVKDDLKAGFLVFLAVVAALSIGVALLAIVTAVRPWFYAKQREAAVASHQYVEARRDAIVEAMLAYEQESNPAVREALRRRIAADLAKIPEGARPAGAERFAP